MIPPIPNEHREAVTHALNLMDKDDIGNGGLSWGESENYADAAIAQMLRLGYRIAPGWVACSERMPDHPGIYLGSDMKTHWLHGAADGSLHWGEVPGAPTHWREIDDTPPPANPSTPINTTDSGKEMI